MRLSSKALWIIAALLVIGSLVIWWIESESSRELYIALPFVKPINESTTLEWKPVKVTRPELGSDGSEHPGFALAKAHCSRCHLFPEPAQLPRQTWPFVLTWMSNYLGYTNTYPPFGNNVEGSLVAAMPLVSGEGLRTLCEYYLLYSSDGKQHAEDARPVLDPTVQFTLTVPELGLPGGGLVTLVDFDAERKHLYIGLGHEKVVQVFDERNRLLLSKTVHSAPVGIETTEGGFRMTSMGQFMEDTLEGRVVDVVVAAGQVRESTVVEGYHRLTESQTIDLDRDGHSDLLLIGFGAGVEGQVSVRWAGDEDETVLIDYAGALNAHGHDFDGNGQDDILLLTSQEKQEVLLFLNRGGRKLERRLIHQEFAGFGYNHIEHADFNGDGLEDLLVVNGNNMEIRDAPLKNYHGIRIFENQGDLSFTESYFYPMYGALKALAYDFDEDGDQDIVAIAFYPDWSGGAPETFVYLENLGGDRFRSSGLNSEQTGRWISMCLGDLNRDGWEDIILGAGYIPQGVKTSQREWFSEWARERPSVVVLTNRGRPSSGP